MNIIMYIDTTIWQLHQNVFLCNLGISEPNKGFRKLGELFVVIVTGVIPR